MKGKRTDLGQANCGIARALQIIGDWWSLLIVREAFGGKQRFGEFQKSLGLAKNILSSRLKKLVEEGIFTIEPDPESALSHRYVLTAKGEQLYIVLIALWQWGEENCFEPGELNVAMVDTPNGQPLTKLRLLAQDGRVLGPGNFRVAPKPSGSSRAGN
ncbi:winged helix-turn-helix transcriptional regulator [Azospirillum canadense]|uniref:winged helix-turn-helix transcriptional regulator n=1 Tax=Azospirillum canadense TaxID=403962 RepID=UPI00222773BE|nr:helix-turn-helix domain-containing protein [Azospirillum canadense]MCW2236037.1 DNA-binding HxlR family transcriptional regulator [Azospirillum canadense]